MQVIWTAPALTDLAALLEYIRRDNPNAAHDMGATLLVPPMTRQQPAIWPDGKPNGMRWRLRASHRKWKDAGYANDMGGRPPSLNIPMQRFGGPGTLQEPPARRRR